MQVELRQTAAGWQFKSEVNLEHFVWSNLPNLLQLTPLQQQYFVKGQVCDLLGVDAQRRLTVIELKNSEDRYIVQQLTRYYAALREVQPFTEQVDYQQSIQLIAIAPSFHRDNYTDRHYSTLSIRFLQFVLSGNSQDLYLRLMEVDGDFGTAIQIPTQPTAASEIPSPPRVLLNILNKSSAPTQAVLLQLRQRILSFDGRMQEQTSMGCVSYGRGKGKPCAEIRFDPQRNCPVLFLWLPLQLQGLNRKRFTARMRIWTVDWATVSDLGHVPKGLGKMVSLREWEELTVRPLNKALPRQKILKEQYFNSEDYRKRLVERNKFLGYDASYRSGIALSFERYRQYTGQPTLPAQLNAVVEVALQTWLNRL